MSNVLISLCFLVPVVYQVFTGGILGKGAMPIALKYSYAYTEAVIHLFFCRFNVTLYYIDTMYIEVMVNFRRIKGGKIP